MKQFHIDIFHILIKNCTAKLMRRFGEFKHSFLASKSDDSSIPTTTGDLVTALQSWKTKHPAPPARNNADVSAISYSPTSNLYEGLILTIQWLQNHIAAHAYCIGCSSIMDDVVNEYPRLANVIETARKYGEYFRGASRLYTAITTPGKSDFCKSFAIIHIPSPPPESITLEENWYYVLEVLYYRYNCRCLPITEGDFLREYRNSIEKYKDWKTIRFIPHCEITLIRYLIPRYHPTEIGVSKSCCATCYEFIKGLNATRMTRQWGIQGGHGNVYLTARGIELDKERDAII
jgi:OTT_1508-like deaminase